MTTSRRTHAAYQHALLVHDTDEELFEATRAFVARGLASGGDVLVHGTRGRRDSMRELLGSHPRLGYGLDDELYQAPMPTLFSYQHTLATRSPRTRLWVTGTVPLGVDDVQQAAWHRYESAVDDALGTYPFVALCTYDTRTCPPSVIAAALATHRTVHVDLTDRDNPQYVEPATFLAAPLAQRPAAPTGEPSAVTVVHDREHLSEARDLVKTCAYRNSAVSPQTIEQLRVAVNEVTANGLLHGRPPVRLSVWTDLASVTCLVEDSGAGHLDPMTGFRHPVGATSMGLWAARQLVNDLVIASTPSGGCSVLLTVTDQPL